MKSQTPINGERIRKITGSFSWLDHRLMTHGFLDTMQPYEMLLYFFLVLVGDRNGLSFYSYDKICTLLKMDLDIFIKSRDGLVAQSLIAYQDGRFQVLQLPAKPVGRSPPERRSPWPRSHHPQALGEILQQVFSQPDQAGM